MWLNFFKNKSSKFKIFCGPHLKYAFSSRFNLSYINVFSNCTFFMFLIFLMHFELLDNYMCDLKIAKMLVKSIITFFRVNIFVEIFDSDIWDFNSLFFIC